MIDETYQDPFYSTLKDKITEERQHGSTVLAYQNEEDAVEPSSYSEYKQMESERGDVTPQNETVPDKSVSMNQDTQDTSYQVINPQPIN